MDSPLPSAHALERLKGRFVTPRRPPTGDEHIGWAADAHEQDREPGELLCAVTQDAERLAVGVVMTNVDDNADPRLGELSCSPLHGR